MSTDVKTRTGTDSCLS